MSLLEIVLRLGAATLIGAAIGLNRDLHGKPTGVRTLGLVALGAALVVVAVAELEHPSDISPLSRVVQGVLTGIGFLGAGVILHDATHENRVYGLTTAAVTWLTACIGLVCGSGNWRLLAVALVLLFALLIVGGPVERMLHVRWGSGDKTAPP